MRQSALGSTGLDEQDVSVLHHVFLALGHHLALGLDLGLVAQLLEHVVVVDDRLDEGLLEVTVDDTGGLRGSSLPGSEVDYSGVLRSIFPLRFQCCGVMSRVVD